MGRFQLNQQKGAKNAKEEESVSKDQIDAETQT